MPLPHASNALPSLEEWHRHPPGRRALDVENGRLAPLLSTAFGYHLLLVGCGDYLAALAEVRVQHHTWLMPPAAPEPGPPGAAAPPPPPPGCSRIRGSAAAMPVASDSVDLVLLPHVLEFEQDPLRVLRETERVLVPEGHAIVAGYNPLGPMGARRLALGGNRGAPWNGRFYTAARVREWLAELGFDTVASERCFHRSAPRSEKLLRRLAAFGAAGPHAWLPLHGSWLLAVRKRTATLTPVRMRRRRRARVAGAKLAGPAMRTPAPPPAAIARRRSLGA